jgi:hypothetical protein
LLTGRGREKGSGWGRLGMQDLRTAEPTAGCRLLYQILHESAKHKQAPRVMILHETATALQSSSYLQ